MTETRRRIVDAVRETPGIHFNAIVRSLDLATGQVQYHVKKLLAEESIQATELYGRTHYFPEGFDDAEQRTVALLRRETTREIVAYLFDHEGARPGDIADAVGVARSTVEWHLDRLIEQDLLYKRREGSNRVTLELRHPEATAALLSEVDPGLLDTMLSGYERLLDDVFYEDRDE